MPIAHARFFFDFIDPLSYLVAREFGEIDASECRSVSWVPFELRSPPSPLIASEDPSLSERWTRARLEVGRWNMAFDAPDLVPWTRKAHELALFAEARGVGGVVRTRIFETYLLEKGDIGRVDVLVEVGQQAGLDPVETKAVLDVDRYEAAVSGARMDAEAIGVTDTPTLMIAGKHLRGFHNRSTLGTFLGI